MKIFFKLILSILFFILSMCSIFLIVYNVLRLIGILPHNDFENNTYTIESILIIIINLIILLPIAISGFLINLFDIKGE